MSYHTAQRAFDKGNIAFKRGVRLRLFCSKLEGEGAIIRAVSDEQQHKPIHF